MVLYMCGCSPECIGLVGVGQQSAPRRINTVVECCLPADTAAAYGCCTPALQFSSNTDPWIPDEHAIFVANQTGADLHWWVAPG